MRTNKYRPTYPSIYPSVYLSVHLWLSVSVHLLRVCTHARLCVCVSACVRMHRCGCVYIPKQPFPLTHVLACAVQLSRRPARRSKPSRRAWPSREYSEYPACLPRRAHRGSPSLRVLTGTPRLPSAGVLRRRLPSRRTTQTSRWRTRGSSQRWRRSRRRMRGSSRIAATVSAPSALSVLGVPS